MIFEQIATGGCQSYFIACGETCTAAVIDPEVRQLARYQALATQYGARIRYVVEGRQRRHRDERDLTRIHRKLLPGLELRPLSKIVR